VEGTLAYFRLPISEKEKKTVFFEDFHQICFLVLLCRLQVDDDELALVTVVLLRQGRHCSGRDDLKFFVDYKFSLQRGAAYFSLRDIFSKKQNVISQGWDSLNFIEHLAIMLNVKVRYRESDYTILIELF
jgi:hypothetical protein